MPRRNKAAIVQAPIDLEIAKAFHHARHPFKKNQEGMLIGTPGRILIRNGHPVGALVGRLCNNKQRHGVIRDIVGATGFRNPNQQRKVLETRLILLKKTGLLTCDPNPIGYRDWVEWILDERFMREQLEFSSKPTQDSGRTQQRRPKYVRQTGAPAGA